MNKREATFQTKFNKWVFYNWTFGISARFEHKVVDLSKAKSLNYKSQVYEHQRYGLKSRCVIFKIPDDSIGQKPFDSFIIYGPGYLVVQFWKPRVKHFYMIEITDILNDIKDGNKSLNEEKAKQLAYKIGYLR